MGEDSGGARWRILALLFACRIGLGFQFQALGSTADPLIARFGFSYTEIGTLIGLFMLPGLVLALPAGIAGRHASDRTLVGAGLLAMAAGGAIASMAEGFGLLALGRLAAGAGFVFSTIYLTKMIADWFAGKELATAMGVLVMSWPFGIAMGQVGHVRLAAVHGWPMPFLVAAAYCVLGAIAVLLLYRAPASAPARTGAPNAVGRSRLPRAELVLTLIAATVWALFNAAYVVYLSFAPQVLAAGGYASADAAAVVSLASWVMIASGAIAGQVADRTGRRDLVLYVCLAVAALAMLLLPQTRFAVASSLAFGLIGMAPAGVIMALTGEALAPVRRAFGMGVFFSMFFVQMAVVPPIAGWIFDRGGDPYGPILFAVALLLACAAANVLFRLAQARLRRTEARSSAA